MEDAQQRAKLPTIPLAGPYGHPVHPMLVSLPIGAWFMSIVFDVASRVSSTNGASFYRATLWLIGTGILVALFAAVWGFIDLLHIRVHTLAFRVGLTHAAINVCVVTIYAVEWVLRYVRRDLPRVPVSLVVLNVASYLLLILSGALGGTLAYRYGVRVADEETQAEGFAEPSRAPRDLTGKPREA
jgi:uncharacterized membrane protein